MGRIAPAVHDLLRVDPALAERWLDAPAWVAPALAAAPWVVVRRAASDGIPVGVRGATRAQRFAATLEPGDVHAVRTPYELLLALPHGSGPLDSAARAVRALAAACRVRCGVAGSYGFECASGVRATSARSDLDLIVDAAAGRTALADFARGCESIASATHVRMDVLAEGPAGGVALDEVLGQRPQVLVKTAAGPQFLHR